MILPVQVTFHNVDHSDAIETDILERAQKLNRFYDRITSCRVVVERPHASQNKGDAFRVRIDLTVPGEEIVVANDPGDGATHDDPYVAVRDAFKAMRRRLEDHVRTRRDRERAAAPR